MARRRARVWTWLLTFGAGLVAMMVGARLAAPTLAKRYVAEAASMTRGAWRYENAEHAFGAVLPASISGPHNACVERYSATADAQSWTEHYG